MPVDHRDSAKGELTVDQSATAAVQRLAAEAWQKPLAVGALGVAAVLAGRGMGAIMARQNLGRALEAVSANTFYVEGALSAAHNECMQGTGFLVSEKGHVATAYHVVRDAGEIMLTDRSGRSFGAKMIGADPTADVALLKMTGHHGAKPPEMVLRPPAGGEKSLAIGYPGGSLQPVTSEGSFLSERHAVRSAGAYYGRLQRPALSQLAVEMKMVPGNSGSPLLDGSGKVYGLVTEGSLDVTTAHAAPISKVLDLLKQAPI